FAIRQNSTGGYGVLPGNGPAHPFSRARPPSRDELSPPCLVACVARCDKVRFVVGPAVRDGNLVVRRRRLDRTAWQSPDAQAAVPLDHALSSPLPLPSAHLPRCSLLPRSFLGAGAFLAPPSRERHETSSRAPRAASRSYAHSLTGHPGVSRLPAASAGTHCATRRRARRGARRIPR